MNPLTWLIFYRLAQENKWNLGYSGGKVNGVKLRVDLNS